MLDDLALVLAPPLDGHVEELAVVHVAGCVGLQVAKRSTSCRCRASNHGGSPAAAFAWACSGFRVAGMTTSTRSSESAHFSSACGHVSTPSSASTSAGTER